MPLFLGPPSHVLLISLVVLKGIFFYNFSHFKKEKHKHEGKIRIFEKKKKSTKELLFVSESEIQIICGLVLVQASEKFFYPLAIF